MKIAIIVGSIREGRTGSVVGQWVKDQADAHEGAEGATYDLLELADFDVPLLTDPTVPGAANREYASEKTRAFGAAMDSYDGFVWVTPEYNHGVPGGFKNAFDSLYPEWMNKAVGFVSYGADAGVRAVEQWRPIVANAHMIAVRAQVSMGLFTDFNEAGFAPLERRAGELQGMLDQVTAMTTTLASHRG